MLGAGKQLISPDAPTTPPARVPLRVLLVEDSECDAELVLHELQHGGYEPTWERVDTAAALAEALERRRWDVILCDYVMPRFSAMAALSLLSKCNCDLPTIIVSGEVGEEVAAETMRAGAHDYVSKHRLTRLVPAVERELQEAEGRRARKRAEEALRESEDRYRDLVENSRDLLCTHDLEGRVLSINPAPARALGYEPEEALGRNLRDILAPEVRGLFVDYLTTVGRDGVAKGLMLVLTRTGERRVWEYHNTLRTDGVAAPIVRGMARDVTERVRAEAALRDGERHFRSLIENGMDLVAILSVDGVFRYVNPAHEQASGFKPEELIGKSAFDFIHPDDVPETRRRFAEGAQQGRTTGTAEYRFLHKNGSWHYVEGIARNLLDDPVVKGILVNARDISERKRAEEEIRRLNAELERRLRQCTEKLEAAAKDRKALS